MTWPELGEEALECLAVVVALALGYAGLVVRQRAERDEWIRDEQARRRRRDDPATYGGAESETSREVWWSRYEERNAEDTVPGHDLRS